MKKFLRFILILLLILVVGFLVLCVVTDSELKIERTTLINAPKAVVWEQVVKFKNWEHWNAWKEQDTTVVVSFSGNDGEQGSTYHYKGNPMTGEGTETNMGVTDGEMKYAMNFISPFTGTADGYYKVVEEGGKTKVIWYFHQDLSFTRRGFVSIFGVQKMLTKTFDRGLELLKNYCEAHAAEAPASGVSMAITEVQFPAHIYAGIRKTVKFADMHNFFMQSYSVLGKEAGQRFIGPGSGLYYTWDPQNMQTDLMAAFPVADNAPVKGATIAEVPAATAYKMDYIGPYQGMAQAHNAMQAHLKQTGRTSTLVIEEYIKTPSTETDSNKYETNIIYLLK